MYRKIVVGYEAGEQGEDALALARLLAEGTGAELLVANVYMRESYGDLVDDRVDAHLREQAERRIATALSDFGEGVVARGVAVPGTSPAQGLHHLAESEEADMVVVGATARGPVGRTLVGSTTERLLQGAPCAVAAAPRGYRERSGSLRLVGVAFAASPESEAALRAAEALAQTLGASLHVFSAVEPPQLKRAAYGDYSLPPGFTYSDIEQAFDERIRGAFDRAVESLPRELNPEGTLLFGDPAEELSRRAREESVDLLVTGSRGYGPLGRVLVGGVSSALMRSAPCPLLVVPRGAGSSPAQEDVAHTARPV